MRIFDFLKRKKGGNAQHEEPNKFGMSTLRVPVDEAGAIDIIAIHGLGGHYKNTWKWVSEDGTQEHDWLVEFLPKQIPNARIMTYGYNSAVQFSKSVADIRVFATQLLNDLETKRLTPCQECRPIVFICHSLGGLVFKRALIEANEQHRFSDTLGHIQGVAFFATPHTGASLANWGAMFGKILKASSVGTSGNTKPLKDLENRGAVVQDITRSAIDRLKMLPTILTFIETETMPYLGFRVVDEDSAVLNLPNEQRFFMNANHLNICKFKDPEGPYEQVSVRLKAMSDALIKKVKTQMQNDFVGAVSSGNEQAVEELLLQGADPDLPENPTPLWLAAIGKHAAIVKILLKTRRVNVEAENKSNHGERAIHEPCIWGGRDEIQIVEALLDAHANIEGTTIGAWTPLHQAARFHGSEELMRFLIQRGADVEAVIGRCLSTPLHLAAEVGNIGKIKVLLKAGARPDIEDVDGRTPKVRAEENNHAEAANLL